MACRITVCLSFVASLIHGGFASPVPPEGLSSAPLLDGLAEQLVQDYPSQPPVAIEKALSDGLKTAADDEGMQLSDLTCNRDYSVACPEGWVDTGDGSTCAAPLAYKGVCAATVSFGGLTPNSKSRLADKCGAAFPCSGACTPEYQQGCPLGWDEDASHECLAPLDYAGPCVGHKKFATASVAQKESWGKACGARWPCRSQSGGMFAKRAGDNECMVDYAGSCPDRWVSKGGWCSAPADYNGKCGFFLASAHYTREEKQAFSEACDAPWPCISAIF